ncbi:hypothetical protein MTO96_046254 [Rhipicephalus appendiculatus]
MAFASLRLAPQSRSRRETKEIRLRESVRERTPGLSPASLLPRFGLAPVAARDQLAASWAPPSNFAGVSFELRRRRRCGHTVGQARAGALSRASAARLGPAL